MTMIEPMEIGSDMTTGAYLARAGDLIARGDLRALPNILARAERHRDDWVSEEGAVLTVALLEMLIDAYDRGEGDPPGAMRVCPPWLAAQARDLLVQALCPDGDAAELDDAALLTLALLSAASGDVTALPKLIEAGGRGRDALLFGRPADAIVRAFAIPSSAETDSVTKLVIWDLDDTLWSGTLADGDVPRLHEGRAAVVRALNRQGVVSAICSKNSAEAARAVLERMELWDEFVFRRIAFVPKGAVVAQMIADMQLRPVDVLFVDDNPHNLHAVGAAVPGIRTLDARDAECDRVLAGIVADTAYVAKSRVAEYRLLEDKVADRAAQVLDDGAFLLASGIEATFVERMEALEFAPRMEELVNRSNQLNYTASRATPGSIRDRLLEIDRYIVLAAFVWDRYGYYGLVGVAVLDFLERRLEHFALSCRIMHMGVEAAMIARLERAGHRIDAAQLAKPLPAQSARAITLLPFHDPEVRERVLAAEAPRDWSRIALRIMADCQSAAFHHYSRFAGEADFDNAPRLFNLPMFRTGEADAQALPRYLVYAAGTDYTDFRWIGGLDYLSVSRIDADGALDVAVFETCLERFAARIVADDHRVLVLLPPEDRPVGDYALWFGCDPERVRGLHAVLNDLWRDVARRSPAHVTLVELADIVAAEEMTHAHHYVPSALRRIAGVIDDWYAPFSSSDAPAPAPR